MMPKAIPEPKSLDTQGTVLRGLQLRHGTTPWRKGRGAVGQGWPAVVVRDLCTWVGRARQVIATGFQTPGACLVGDMSPSLPCTPGVGGGFVESEG